MSFSLDVKEELARVSPVCSHCNRALLSAYARMAGTLHMQRADEAKGQPAKLSNNENTISPQVSNGNVASQVQDKNGGNSSKVQVGANGREQTEHGNQTHEELARINANFSLEMSSDIASVARLLTQVLHDDVRLQTEITMRRSILHKNVNYLIALPPQPRLLDVLSELGFFGVANDAPITNTTKPLKSTSENLVAKKCCSAAFVRGAFLASGFISDPKSNAHFEITFENETMAEDIAHILEQNKIPARVKSRRSSYVVYLKSGEHIVNFLSFTGAHTSALKLEDARVMKSVRSGVNRQINAELANQKKAAVAAVDQVFAARAVIEHYGASKLTPALQEFIRLRIKYPNASLKELGEHATPPLSKSAVAHRVRRMMQLAQNIKN